MVDVFRRPEHTPDVARQAVAAGARALWLQLGIANPEARAIAEEGGLQYVEDHCLKVEHVRLLGRSVGGRAAG
jgi:predicted CoA-binding protein